MTWHDMEVWNCCHFRQLRTWVHDNHCYLGIKSDTGQHSQFLRCFLQLLLGKRVACFQLKSLEIRAIKKFGPPLCIDKLIKWNSFCQTKDSGIFGAIYNYIMGLSSYDCATAAITAPRIAPRSWLWIKKRAKQPAGCKCQCLDNLVWCEWPRFPFQR